MYGRRGEMKDILADLNENEKKVLANVARALRGIRFGYVQITVQDSVVVQIDKTEKMRPDRQGAWDYEI